MADTKFSAFLTSKKLDARRIMIASHELETLTPEDRAIRLAKRRARKAEGGDKNAETRKPRSGRPVTNRAIEAAMTGKTVSGPTKTRILRAVNHVLAAKKQEAVDLRALF
jgi:tRNA pseudouridine-54 N-methylase